MAKLHSWAFKATPEKHTLLKGFEMPPRRAGQETRAPRRPFHRVNQSVSKPVRTPEEEPVQPREGNSSVCPAVGCEYRGRLSALLTVTVGSTTA